MKMMMSVMITKLRWSVSLFHLICLLPTSFFICSTYTHPHQTVMVSLEGLSKIVDPSQLTADFEGSLDYNHDDWIEV